MNKQIQIILLIKQHVYQLAYEYFPSDIIMYICKLSRQLRNTPTDSSNQLEITTSNTKVFKDVLKEFMGLGQHPTIRLDIKRGMHLIDNRSRPSTIFLLELDLFDIFYCVDSLMILYSDIKYIGSSINAIPNTNTVSMLIQCAYLVYMQQSIRPDCIHISTVRVIR